MELDSLRGAIRKSSWLPLAGPDPWSGPTLLQVDQGVWRDTSAVRQLVKEGAMETPGPRPSGGPSSSSMGLELKYQLALSQPREGQTEDGWDVAFGNAMQDSHFLPPQPRAVTTQSP